MSELDLWSLESGLRDDVVISIATAYFATTSDSNYPNILRLHLVGFDETGEPFTLKMSVGSDWSSVDGGRTISHPTKNRINKNSIYGHFIEASLQIPQLANVLRSRGNPLSAEVWQGLIIHCQAKEIKFGRDIEAREYLMPTEFMGFVEDGQPQTLQSSVQSGTMSPAPTAPAPPAPAPAQPTPAVSAADRVAAARAAKAAPAPAANGTHPLYPRLSELAKATSSHTEFLTRAFDIDEVLADDALAEHVADPANYAYYKG